MGKPILCSDEQLKDFCCAIVMTSIEDWNSYRLDEINAKESGWQKFYTDKRIAIESFFKSDWFALLCDVDGEKLPDLLEDKLQNDLDPTAKPHAESIYFLLKYVHGIPA